MEDQLLFNTRLLLFAGHIININNDPEHGLTTEYPICEIDSDVRLHFHIKCHDYIFEQLLIFEDSWEYDDYGMPVLKGMPPNSTLEGIIDYFGLSIEELCFCFDTEGYQNTEMFGGGNILSEDSTGLQIAQNILLVVQKRRKDNSR